MINCPSCSGDLTVREVINNCERSWPSKRWVLFRCPFCLKGTHLEVVNDYLTVGTLDGVPGPCFVGERRHHVSDLVVSTDSEGIELVCDEDRAFVPAKIREQPP